MPAVSLHGVTIAWSVAEGCRDALAPLLSVFPASVAEAEGGAVHVRFALRSAPESAAAHPRADGWEPSFFHGAVDTFRGPEAFLIWDHASRILVPHDGGTIDARLAPASREVTSGSTSTALQLALILALRPLGFFHLHAAALALPSGMPAIIVGRTGAGKTTTTLALLEQPGTEFLCDDSIYVTRAAAATTESDLELVAFPRDFHVGPTALATFPRLAPLAGAVSPHTDKRELDPRAAYPGRFRPFLSVGSHEGVLALFPSVTSAERTIVAPLARADAFGRLLGSSGALVVEGVLGREQNLSALQALLAAARCFEVQLGRDAIDDPSGAIAAPLLAL